jgi:hypothetical protein
VVRDAKKRKKSRGVGEGIEKQETGDGRGILELCKTKGTTL